MRRIRLCLESRGTRMEIMKALLPIQKKHLSKLYLFEDKKKSLKSLKHNVKLQVNWWARHKLSATPLKKVNTRCILTGRGKSINQSFKLSRLELARWVRLKILVGVDTGSW